MLEPTLTSELSTDATATGAMAVHDGGTGVISITLDTLPSIDSLSVFAAGRLPLSSKASHRPWLVSWIEWYLISYLK